jgi:hypothetical protein
VFREVIVALEMILAIWVLLSAVVMYWVNNRQKPRVYYYGGYLLILIGFTCVYWSYQLESEVPEKFSDLASQLIIMASAVIGANFITHSITMDKTPNKEINKDT